MIHHLARAFFIRSSSSARPIVVKTEPRMAYERPSTSPSPRRLRICSDPSDARRTVITGRFADVCAALDRLVLEQEAIA
ncbi:MAG: hypothetical protein V4532_16075 [Pseudomonadota bacterium]